MRRRYASGWCSQPAQELKTQIETTEQIASRFKEEGNRNYGAGNLGDAIGAYTSSIVVLTGERDPRVKQSVVDVTEEEEKKPAAKPKVGKDAGLPEGVTAIDPTQHQQEPEPIDPMAEMGRCHESGYASDYEVQRRMERAALFLQRSEVLRLLLATCYHNRSLASIGLSEGKEKSFKDRITSAPGGIDKWDSYRVRMTVDALNDSRTSVQLDPKNPKAWYRIGYCIYRLTFLIDRIRERKPWLREDELPLLEKPAMWEEARQSLIKAIELKEANPAAHEKLKEVLECMGKMTMIVRKLGHENLGIDVNPDTMVLEAIDDESPSKKWGLTAFIGCKITHLKVGDDGPLLPVSTVEDLSKRQTYASYVTLGFLPKDPIPPAPGQEQKPQEATQNNESEQSPQEKEAEKEEAPLDSKWGPPPPRVSRLSRTSRETFIYRMQMVPAVFMAILAVLLAFVIKG
eukprot:TRINITY_DN1750_c0_g2_i3.p1 TRINITY_DN1750_c0_g2~~TRINITY_DN1750_c0_g2_i3.p1  ORF type:complete len:458 (+),score=129.50 TRINITY_DN1750_c0_g2_i3:94-1467(+)